jgi:type 1 glutamine amidotransferase
VGKSKFIKTGLLLVPGLLCGMAAEEAHAQTKSKLKSVMVLEHGTGPGHRASSDDLNASLRDLGTTHGFTVKVLAQSVNLDVEFSAENLAKYQVVILSNNDGVHRFIAGTARNNFQAYVENGGGLLAVHASSAFIDGWTWINDALVAKFYGPHQSHGPAADLKQDAEGLKAETEARGIVKDFTAPAGFIDEYYQFQTNPRGKTGVTILLTVDEKTPGANFQSPMGADHPVTWLKPVGKGRVVHNSLGHSFKEKGHNVYTQKSNYLKNFTYTSLRFAAGDFIGCMDNKYQEFNPDAIKSDPLQCKTPAVALVEFNKDWKQSELPLVSQNETGTLLNVEFFKQGPNAITIADVSGKLVYQKTGSGQARYSVPTPKKSGIYIVKAKAGNKVSTHRVTVL